jgi:protein CpxP
MCSLFVYLYITPNINIEKMKKFVLVCALVLGATVTFAQNGGNGGGGRGRRTPEQQVTRLKEQLTLTDDQSAKVLAIYTAQSKVMDSLRTAANGDFQSMRPAMTALNKKTSEKILPLLTPEQATAYKKQLEEQAKAMAARQQGN